MIQQPNTKGYVDHPIQKRSKVCKFFSCCLWFSLHRRKFNLQWDFRVFIESTKVICLQSFLRFSKPEIQKTFYKSRCHSQRVFSRLLVTTSFAFSVITFETIEVQTCSAPQNNHLNLIFVKYIYVNSWKLARNGWKTCIYHLVYHLVINQVQKNIFAFCVITFEPI